MNEEKILACPFCGKQPAVFPSGDGTGEMVECVTPGCVNPHVSYYGKNVARKKWNARAGGLKPATSKTPEPSTSASATCYAIGMDDGFIISFGASVIAAWNAAEDCVGDKCKTLQKQGYKLLEGKWHNEKLTHGGE